MCTMVHRPVKGIGGNVMAIDPVCEMEVDEETVEFRSQYASQTYYFCSAECQELFEQRPEQYARAA